MPLFEYRCSECHEKFEELVSYSESHGLECPNCGSSHTEKLMSTFATTGNSARRDSSPSCRPGTGFT